MRNGSEPIGLTGPEAPHADPQTAAVVGVDVVEKLFRELHCAPHTSGRARAAEHQERWRALILQARSLDTYRGSASGEELAAVEDALRQIPQLSNVLRVLDAAGTLDDPLLFEAKRFVFHAARALRPLEHLEGLQLRGLSEALDELRHAMHPEERPSASFALVDADVPKLRGARAAARTARRTARELRAGLESEILADYGGSFDIRGELVVDTAAAGLGSDPRLAAGARGWTLASADLQVAEAAWDAADRLVDTLEDSRRAAITAVLRAGRQTLGAAAEAVVRVDRANAAAVLRERWDGCWPERTDEPVIEIVEGRNPRLTGSVQPVSLAVDERAVIVTGQNLGGKTSMMELVGVATWCATHALPVPARSFRWRPVSAIVYVGPEEPSLRGRPAGLSAFGAEIARIVENLGHEAPALWLLDEVGRGTHPDEGARLAEALIRKLSKAGHFVLAATHFPQLTSLEDARVLRTRGFADSEALRERLAAADGDVDSIARALGEAADYAVEELSSAPDDIPRNATLLAEILGLSLQD